ncbi:hypothetical protein D1872_316560 [compost metagenome]
MISTLLKAVHFLTNIFEASQRIKYSGSKMLSNNCSHFTGYNRFDDGSISRQLASLLKLI